MPEFHLDTAGEVYLSSDLKATGCFPIKWATLDAFTQGYIEALFFTSDEELRSRVGAIEDGRVNDPYGFADLAPETLATIIADCAAFKKVRIGEQHPWDGVCQVFNETRHAEAGRDFWYTRNGHGAGFWDGDWPEPYASELTAAAKAAGQVDVYLGDDGKVYLS